MKTLKKIAKRVAPELFFKLKRRQRHRQFTKAHGGAEFRAKRALVDRHGQQVLSGPFKGMIYGDDVACSAYVAKLVGSYEEELHEAVEQIIHRGYRKVIDVGCAEGYYAVGLAIRLPEALVYAFDADPDASRYCRDLAQLNGVQSRVIIGGFCDHGTLDRLADENTIIVCDCEGFELQLLDPARVQSLRVADMLIELHDVFHPGLTSELLERFEATHHITLINTRDRDPAEYPVLDAINLEDRYWAVREGRQAAMQWAYLTCRRA